VATGGRGQPRGLQGGSNVDIESRLRKRAEISKHINAPLFVGGIRRRRELKAQLIGLGLLRRRLSTKNGGVGKKPT